MPKWWSWWEYFVWFLVVITNVSIEFRIENSSRRYWETLEKFPSHVPFVPMSAYAAFIREMSTGLGGMCYSSEYHRVLLDQTDS